MATRRERVVLDLEDRFTSPMLRAAAAAKTLDKSLNDLDGSTVRTDRDMDRLGSSSGSLSKAAVQSRAVTKEIDRMSGRVRVVADVAAILGPALIPIGAVALPAITGLAAQMGAAAIAGGTMVVAFQGVGTALEAVNKAALEPTAETLAAARIAMQSLGPEAQNLVRQVQEMRPAFLGLRNAAAAGLFPGLSAALGDMERVFPNLERILFRVGDAAGDLGAELGESLAGPRGQEFLSFIEAEMPRALTDLGHIVGNLAAGVGELWMAFTPINNDFAGWLLNASQAFDQWASGLSQTQGFQDFVAYLRENGPRVADALGSIGNALLQIVEAAAPLGGPVLQALTAVADAIAAIMGSDAGPAIMATVTALALLSRGQRAFGAVAASSWGQAMAGAQGYAARVSALRSTALRGGAALAGIGIAASGVADNFGLANTASGALLGTLGGPWGAAIGGAIGLMLDLSASSEAFKVNSDELQATLNQQTGAVTANTTAWAANELEKGGVLSAAQQLGLSLDDVTQAALGNSGAMARVNAGLEDAKTGFYNADGSIAVGVETLEKYRGNLNTVQGAIGSVGGALDSAQGRFRRVAAATGELADSYRQGASAAQRFANAIEAANRVLTARAGAVAYEQAVDDLTKAIRQNGKTLDINTQKGRDNRSALDAVAASAVNMAKDMNRTNGIKVLTQARQDIVDAAMKLGKTRGEAQSLADRLLGLNGVHAEPSVDLDASGFFSTAARVGSELGSLAGRAVTTYVNTVHRSIKGNADGGTVVGPRQPYGDKVLTYLAPGEEVISNRYGQADRHREVLRAINANRLGNGGTVVDAINRASSHWSPSVSVTTAPTISGTLRVRGTLDTPWGPADIDGMIEDRITDFRHHDSRPATRWAGVSRD